MSGSTLVMCGASCVSKGTVGVLGLNGNRLGQRGPIPYYIWC